MPDSINVGTIPAVILGVAYIIGQIVTHINKFGDNNNGKLATITMSFIFAILGFFLFLFEEKIRDFEICQVLLAIVGSTTLLILSPSAVMWLSKKILNEERSKEVVKIELKNVDVQITKNQ